MCVCACVCGCVRVCVVCVGNNEDMRRTEGDVAAHMIACVHSTIAPSRSVPRGSGSASASAWVSASAHGGKSASESESPRQVKVQGLAHAQAQAKRQQCTQALAHEPEHCWDRRDPSSLCHER